MNHPQQIQTMMSVDKPFFHKSVSELNFQKLHRHTCSQSKESLRPALLRQREQQIHNKLRYQHMLQLQHVSFLEKQEYSRQRQELVKDNQARAQARVQLLKQQQNLFGKSTREWHHRNLCQAAQLRMKKMVDELYCSEREHVELAQKQQLTSVRRNSFRMAYRRTNKRNSHNP